MTPFGYRVLGFGSGGVAPAYVTATGPDGAAGVTDGDYKYHIFTATKTGSDAFVVSNAGDVTTSNTVEYLVIAGGGGGGHAGGGGGAGGYRTAAGFTSPTVGNHNITIGAGGSGGTTGLQGTNGRDSVLPCPRFASSVIMPVSEVYRRLTGQSRSTGDQEITRVHTPGRSAGKFRERLSSFGG